MIATTHAGFHENLAQLSVHPEEIRKEQFIACRGKYAKESASYTSKLAEIFWSNVIQPPAPSAAVSAMVMQSVTSHLSVEEAQEILSSLVTRQISLKSDEAQSPKAIAARDKELAGHHRRVLGMRIQSQNIGIF